MDNQDSVAYISRITDIQDIPNSDNLQLALINGWQGLVQKNVHKIGDLILCITQDAVIPDKLSLDWGVNSYLKKGNRVRTVRLRGVYSECILIKLVDLPSIDDYRQGMDMMKILGITKYEEPVKQVTLSNGKKFKYHENPNFHIYHKFPNFKNCPEIFDSKDIVVITRKLHGTNARYGIIKKAKLSIWDRIKKLFTKDPWIDFEYVYGSHRTEKGSTSQGFYSTDVWKTIAEKFYIEKKLRAYCDPLVKAGTLGSGLILYGEIYGPGIQKNYDYELKDIMCRFFDIELDGKYLNHIDFIQCTKYMNLLTVDILYFGKFDRAKQEEYIFNNYIINTKIPHEGIVVKDVSGDRHKIYKCINPEYLIWAEKYNVTDNH